MEYVVVVVVVVVAALRHSWIQGRGVTHLLEW